MQPAPSQALDDARGQTPPHKDWVNLLGSRAALLAATALLLIALSLAFLFTRHPIKVHIDGQEVTVYTNAPTVLGALNDARLSVDVADRVLPGRYAPVEAGLVVRVERAVPVSVSVDGGKVELKTQATTVAEALAEAGVALAPEDLVLAQGVPVDPSANLADTGTTTLLAAADGAPARPRPSAREGRYAGGPAPASLVVKRAVPVIVHDAGLETTINTAADTVGAALRGAGINVYMADLVQPDVGAPVQANMHVYIERSKAITIVCDDPEIAPIGSFVTRSRRDTLRGVLADEGIVLSGREVISPDLDTPTRHGMEVTIRRYHPVSIKADGRTINTKTKKATVAELLADEQIALGPLDKVTPALDSTPVDGTVVSVTRVREVVNEEDEPIPFETDLVQPSAELELDQRSYQEGVPGILRKRVRTIYENGVPVSKTVLDDWVYKQPVPEVTYYGTKVVIRELDTPEGKVKYWRKLTVLATYYHNSTSSKLPGDPTWGITRTGTRTAKGTIATDPNVIPLWSKMYVPGFGVGTALDTGGGVKGKHIDIWLPEGESWWGVRYVTIYLLTPVPDWYPERLP